MYRRATLEVSVSEGPVLRFENNATGIRGLLRHSGAGQV